ncbi:MAG: hypothetical protein PF486_15150 [Prolixibacteraceae bacterium]|jgi:hypothetical protein|nr:hypothetical protein [Prolixibacteraceae bacterium]
MANKRELKKDIRYLTEQVIMDALEVASTFDNDDDKKKALNIIIELTKRHNELLSRANHPDGKENRKIVKQHYNSIISDLLDSCNTSYEKLGKLTT